MIRNPIFDRLTETISKLERITISVRPNVTSADDAKLVEVINELYTVRGYVLDCTAGLLTGAIAAQKEPTIKKVRRIAWYVIKWFVLSLLIFGFISLFV